MMMSSVGFGYHHLGRPPSIPLSITNTNSVTRRYSIGGFFSASLLTFPLSFTPTCTPLLSSTARQLDEQEESIVVRLFQETSPSVVFIEVLTTLNNSKKSKDTVKADGSNTKVEGTGSGFIWDKFGHIVTNYHVVAKLATENSGLQFCKVTVIDAQGSKITTKAQIIGFDPAYDLAVLKFDSQGKEFSPALIGTSRDLHVGQNCFAIGNPYGYENTLTTGVVSGLGREIPSPNGQAIRGAIQTDAAINAAKRRIRLPPAIAMVTRSQTLEVDLQLPMALLSTQNASLKMDLRLDDHILWLGTVALFSIYNVLPSSTFRVV